MKHLKLLWIGLSVILLFSCEERINTTTIESELNADIQLTSQLSENSQLKSNSTSSYFFTGNCTFCLKDNDKFKYCTNNILCVEPGNGAVLSISGITESNEISNMYLEWGYKNQTGDNYNMQSPINLLSAGYQLKNELIEINLDEIVFPLINGLSDYPSCAFKIIIMGNSNFEISTVAKLKIPIVVESESFSPRFTVF